jgi:hypothetical protein
MVHEAESGLAQAIGVMPDVPITVQSFDHDDVPRSLGEDVEKLVSDAIKTRPDIAPHTKLN